MSKPKDQQLYDRIKKKIYNEISNHSAYRSGHLVKEYKKAYKKKYNSDDAYKGKKNKEGLERWFKEDWRNQRGEVGYKKKGDVYRPTKRVNKNTPLTFNELSKNEIKKGMEKKKKNGRVDKFRK
jgi:hypothetical protein